MVGGAVGFFLWFLGFLVIGGEWFQMWQSPTWNGQEPAFRFVVVILAVLIFISAFPLAAQTNDIGVWISTQMNDKGGPFVANETVESRFDNGNGYGVSFGHMFMPNLSGELAFFKTSSDARIVSTRFWMRAGVPMSRRWKRCGPVT